MFTITRSDLANKQMLRLHSPSRWEHSYMARRLHGLCTLRPFWLTCTVVD